jgi:hypothetical protein
VPKVGKRNALGGSDLGGSDFDTVWLGLIAKEKTTPAATRATGGSIELAAIHAPLPATTPTLPAGAKAFGTAGALSAFVGPLRKECDQAYDNHCFNQFVLLFSCVRGPLGQHGNNA